MEKKAEKVTKLWKMVTFILAGLITMKKVVKVGLKLIFINLKGYLEKIWKMDLVFKIIKMEMFLGDFFKMTLKMEREF